MDIRMKSDELITAFEKQQIAKQRAKEEKNQLFVQKAEEVIRANVQTWFGDLAEEFTLGKVSIHYSSGVQRSVTLSFTWQSVPGEVEMYWFQQRRIDYEKPVIRFRSYGLSEYCSVAADHFSAETYDGWNYQVAKGLIPALEIGELLTNVSHALKAQMESHAASEKARRESSINWLKERYNFDFHRNYYGSFNIEEHHTKAMAEFPEMASDWSDLRAAYDQAKLDDDNRKLEERQEQDRIDQERQDEEARLAAEAAGKWEPFILYRIHYGAKVQGEDEERDYFTQTAIVLQDEPDRDGWYYTISYGDIKRIKLINVLRIDECVCMRPNDIPTVYPNSTFASAWLKSEKFSDVEVHYFEIPQEVERLDVDAEVEQRR